MTIFANLESARKFGFVRFDFDHELNLHLVVREDRRGDGQRYRSLALARPEEKQARVSLRRP